MRNKRARRLRRVARLPRQRMPGRPLCDKGAFGGASGHGRASTAHIRSLLRSPCFMEESADDRYAPRECSVGLAVMTERRRHSRSLLRSPKLPEANGQDGPARRRHRCGEGSPKTFVRAPTTEKPTPAKTRKTNRSIHLPQGISRAQLEQPPVVDIDAFNRGLLNDACRLGSITRRRNTLGRARGTSCR